MARIPDAQVSDELPDVQHNNLHRVLANNQEVNVGFGNLARLVHTASRLPQRTRELAILRVSATTGSETEWGQHFRIALASGVSLEEARAIRDGDLSGFSPPDRAAIEFAEAFDQLRVDDAVWAETAAHYEPTEILDLAMVAGLYGLACRITVGLGVEIDEGLTSIADA